MRFEVYNPANGIALLQTRTLAGAWGAVRRLNPVYCVTVRTAEGLLTVDVWEEPGAGLYGEA